MSTSPSVAFAKQISESLQRGDRQGFRKAVTGLVDMDAAIGKSWRSLIEPLLEYGELSLACAAIDRHVAWAGPSAQVLLDQATVYARSARPAAAAAVLERLSKDVPDRASNAFLRGTLALNLGDLAAARGHLLEALAARPLSGQAAYALASIGSLAADQEAAERILTGGLQVDNAPAIDRAMYRYALGKIHADRGDIDAAFAEYDKGAGQVAASRPYEEAVDRAGASRATEGWDRDLIDAIAAKVTIPTDRPIIVTGMPRSGTTLVEQILASHSEVGDGDEVDRFRLIVNDIGGPSAAPVHRLAQRADPNVAAGEYLRLLAERFPMPGKVVDKTLEASRYMGVLAALVPGAPILWLRRKPLAHAWSCFSTFFLNGLGWTFDQRAIAAHLRIEENLLDRWQNMLGDRLKVVDYESLVADKETVIPDMLAHCGLAPEAATLAPERTTRLVRTASVAQVRAPINADRVDAAGNYRRHLEPFVTAYRALGGDL